MSTIRRGLFLFVLVLFLLVGGVFLLQQRERLFGSSATQIDRSAYQAVFLVTNQVYFGKLSLDGETFLLIDTFYLSQPSDAGATTGQLVKRGGEPHGPRDPMIIPVKSVLFVENLRDDSAVVGAIRAFKSGQPAPPAPTATSTVPTPALTGSARPTATR